MALLTQIAKDRRHRPDALLLLQFDARRRANSILALVGAHVHGTDPVGMIDDAIVIVCSDTARDNAIAVADRLRQVVFEKASLGWAFWRRQSVSVGVSPRDFIHGDTAESWLTRSRIALDRAQGLGGNRVEYEPIQY